MLLWQMVLRLAAADVAAHCSGTGNLRTNAVFAAALAPLCRWPAPEAKRALRAFWLVVTGYEAPEEEFLAWERFALTSSYAAKPAAEALPVLFLAITYNPYFLLRQ
jgi:hypothetical protein